ncbi:hypothetical protein U1Q18_048414 [Sarracenia purpurea var. burkii]
MEREERIIALPVDRQSTRSSPIRSLCSDRRNMCSMPPHKSPMALMWWLAFEGVTQPSNAIRSAEQGDRVSGGRQPDQ